MKPSPISIVIPTYNRAHLIGRAVRSVIRSCRDEDEIIVVDDGSTDDTAEALQPFGERIRYVRLPHGGAGRVRNHGVELARHPLLAFLDSDDELIPGYLEAKRQLMDARPDLVFCFSDFASRDEDGHIDRNSLAYWHDNPREWTDALSSGVPMSSIVDLPAGIEDSLVHFCNLYHLEMAGNFVSVITLVVRREAAGDSLYFPEDLPTYEDYECYARLARCGLSAYLECETAWQHRHSGPRLTDADVVNRSRTRITILRRVWGADPDYLARYASEFQTVLAGQQRILTRALLRQGRLREAREILSETKDAPLSWKVLAHMPPGIIRNAAQARTALRRAMQTL